MIRSLSFLAFYMVAAASAFTNNYAVVVSGSTGYYNYRHQADACHAVSLLKKYGLKEENIVSMIYNDVVNSIHNPFPGKLFNKPTKHGDEGEDVYADCHIDYSGEDVTPGVFVDVLLANKEKLDGVGSGKYLASTSDDNVFIFFVDHGANGLVSFPNDELYSDTLVNTLQQMNKAGQYKELVFYLEACESGSMFAKLPDDINIFATTAANAYQSSFAAYCSPNDKVNGKSIGSCLGDLYSVNFLEDLETDNNIMTETLASEYQNVKDKTTKSKVKEFGDMGIAQKKVHNFMASKHYKNSAVAFLINERLRGGATETSLTSEPKAKDTKLTSSRDIQLHYLFNRYGRDDLTVMDKTLTHAALMEELTHRAFVDDVFRTVGTSVMGRDIMEETAPVADAIDCLRTVNQEYIAPTCGAYSDYSLKHVKNVVIMCEDKVTAGATQMEAAETIGGEFAKYCRTNGNAGLKMFAKM